MKKIIACISLVFAMSAGVTALADEAVENTNLAADNEVTVTSDAVYNTVLITDDKDGIVYLNQNDDGYTANEIANFLLKSDAGYGTYTMKRGVTGGAALDDVTITIADPSASTKPLDVTNRVDNGDGTYSIGCFASGLSSEDCTYIVISVTKDSVTMSGSYATGITGESDVNLAVKITDISSEYEVAVGTNSAAVGTTANIAE